MQASKVESFNPCIVEESSLTLIRFCILWEGPFILPFNLTILIKNKINKEKVESIQYAAWGVFFEPHLDAKASHLYKQQFCMKVNQQAPYTNTHQLAKYCS